MKHLYRISALPESVRGWLDETRPPAATFFPRQPSPGSALAIVLLVSIPVIIFVSSTTTDPGDLASGGVAVLILCAVVAWWMRERSKVQALQQGRLRFGMFVGDEGVMWRYHQREAWFFTWEEVTLVDVDVVWLRRGRAPGDFIVRTTEGESYGVGRANDFVLTDVWGALSARGVTFRPDPELKIPPPPVSGLVRSQRVEPTPLFVPAEQHFRKLCKQAGIALVEMQAGSSVGATAGSIDTPSVTRMGRPLKARLSELLRLYAELSTDSQEWLDAERKAAGDTDPLLTVERISFGLSDYEA